MFFSNFFFSTRQCSLLSRCCSLRPALPLRCNPMSPRRSTAAVKCSTSQDAPKICSATSQYSPRVHCDDLCVHSPRCFRDSDGSQRVVGVVEDGVRFTIAAPSTRRSSPRRVFASPAYPPPHIPLCVTVCLMCFVGGRFVHASRRHVDAYSVYRSRWWSPAPRPPRVASASASVTSTPL